MKDSRLYNIDLLRLIALLLLLVDHSFATFAGFWEEMPGQIDIPLYSTISLFSWSFMLQLWVFISGYLFSYSKSRKPSNFKLKNLIKHKAKHLLAPCYIFGLVFLLLDKGRNFDISAKSIFYYLSGVYNLWFLPMLFWVFIFAYSLTKIRVSTISKTIFLLLLSIVSWDVTSLGLGNAFYYLFFFYLGMIAEQHKEVVKNIIQQKHIIIALLIATIVSFLFFKNNLHIIFPQHPNTIFERAYSQILIHLVKLPIAICGIALSYGVATRFCHAAIFKNSIIKFPKASFGIYLFHQIILMLIYYHSPLPSLFGSTFIPWVGLICTSIISYFITKRFLNSKYLKFLVS